MPSRQVPDRIRRMVLARDKVCQCCGADQRLEIDHILPWADGGTHDPSNLQVLCRPCNRRKRRRNVVDAPTGLEGRGDSVPMSMVGVKLDAGMIATIDTEADATGRTRSEMVRRLLADAIAERERKI